jgi:cyclopropane fatty-acyl-phospholipid synthase-like methyltransferase
LRFLVRSFLKHEIGNIGGGSLSFWEEMYSSTSPPPWDIGRPQPAFIRLVRRGELRPGKVLDVGCGKGDNAIFLAKSGFVVVGLDKAHAAIQLAKTKMAEQKVNVDFRVGDALKLARYFQKGEFSNVIDSGFFHTLTDKERPDFVNQLDWVLHPGGCYFMLCFSDKEHRHSYPRSISKDEIREMLTPVFRINYIRDMRFRERYHKDGARGYITSATKPAEMNTA